MRDDAALAAWVEKAMLDPKVEPDALDLFAQGKAP
jgi:hypothetical protein